MKGRFWRGRSDAGIVPALLIAVFGACAGEGSRDAGLGLEASLWARMLAAEDARGTGEDGVAPLVEGLASANPVIRRTAVRGLGRLEQDSLVDIFVPILDDPEPAVRAEAANALGQAARSADAAPVRALLLPRLASESDGRVRGVLAETLGRLRHTGADDVAATARTLAALVTPDAVMGQTLGVARGFHFLTRQPAARSGLPEVALQALRQLAVDPPGADSDDIVATRIRTVAAAALTASRQAGESDVSAILADADPLVRREAIVGIPAMADRAAALALLEPVLSDTAGMVRFEALRARDRLRQPGDRCAFTLSAVRDNDLHVALLAITQLASGCGGNEGLALLDSLAGSLPAAGSHGGIGWHAAARALLSLARLDAAAAQARLAAFIGSDVAFVRAWAGRAAQVMKDERTLRDLAVDPDPNVRTVAITGLAELEGHGADAVYIAQLRDQNDSQLLQAAAAGLEGTTDPEALPALLDAFDRISAAKRETWRDSRVALLERIAALGGPAQEERLAAHLTDHDPRVAGMAGDAIERWTGVRPQTSPSPLPRLEPPSVEEIAALAGGSVTIEMADGGRVVLRLLPWDAPTNAWRFARLAREGYYDGLTFHRVEPNFVVQGGSPAANEYAGDGPYTRDEVGLAGNWRGTVGLSTRGRDTGDAQIYFNLVDNVRLDHDYTVFAEVVSGMDVVDRMQEGALIRRVTVQ